jgi:hypothetical protein
VLTFCCLHTALRAQLALGVKGGVVFAKQERNDFSTTLRNTGNIGLAANLYVAEFSLGGFALQLEALYSNKGGVVHQRDMWEGSDDRIEKLSYIEIPFGLIYLLNFGKVVPYISVAPYYAFLVSYESKFYQQGLKDSYKSNDYGVKLGGGVELKRFQLSAAYSRGFCNVSKDGKEIYNRGVEISLGYFFLNNY